MRSKNLQNSSQFNRFIYPDLMLTLSWNSIIETENLKKINIVKSEAADAESSSVYILELSATVTTQLTLSSSLVMTLYFRPFKSKGAV